MKITAVIRLRVTTARQVDRRYRREACGLHCPPI